MKKETNVWHDGPTEEPENKVTGKQGGPRLTSRFNRWVEHFLTFDLPESPESRVHAPPYDITESLSHYFMTLDLPGTSPADLHVKIAGLELEISGERRALDKWPSPGTRPLFALTGKPRYGKFKRCFTLPPTVDADGAQASYENGVLILALPKRSADKVREIPVGDRLELAASERSDATPLPDRAA